VIPFIGGLLATAPCVVAAFLARNGNRDDRSPRDGWVSRIESRVLVPKVYGRALRLPSAAIIVALLVGGNWGGIVGALLALPFGGPPCRCSLKNYWVDLPGDDNRQTAL